MNLTETNERRAKMRSDYGLYVVALICFVIAGGLLAIAIGPEQTTSQSMNQVAMAIFLILGILFAAGGYASRPKVMVKTTAASSLSTTEPSPQPTPPPPPTEEQVPSIPPTPPPAPTVEEKIPTSAPTVEEPAKVEEEKPIQKTVRRRRRKKTA